MKTRVAVVRCSDYDPENVLGAVREVVGLLGGLEAFVRADDSVFVKPNLLSAREPDMAATTHPAVLEAVVRLVQEIRASVRVGDSPPFKGESVEGYRRHCDITGVSDVCERLGVELVRLEESVQEIPAEKGRLYKKFEVSREIFNSTSWISVPKLKTHELTTFTGAVKNVFGVVPGSRKAMFHASACTDVDHFCEMLVDLLSAIPPRLTIMDAVVGMEGEGPNTGTPRKIGAIIAGTDPVAVDAVCCRLIGVDAMKIGTTRSADERGIGCGRLSEIEILGVDPQEPLIPDFELPSGGDIWTRMPYWLRRLARKQLVPFPQISGSLCKNCLDCLKVCPVEAITGGRKRPAIDLDPCIRCYCCHEVCAYGAIELREGRIGKMWKRRRSRQTESR